MDLVQSLLLAGVASVLTLLATSIGFHFQAREARQVRLADIRREGLLRLYTDRLDGYLAFYRECDSVYRAVQTLVESPTDAFLQEQARGRRKDLWHACTAVTLVGSSEAALAAWDLLHYYSDVIYEGSAANAEEHRRLIRAFIATARRDLHAPESPETPPIGLWDQPEPKTADPATLPWAEPAH